jgi:hypothetical protein
LVHFIDDAFPLIVTISAANFDEAEVRSMANGFERYFGRGERYTVLTVPGRGSTVPGQRERTLIAAWADQPRVRDFSRRLCVGSATVVMSPLARAAFSVITTIWRPPSPVEVVPSVERGLDYCLSRIHGERLKTTRPPEVVRGEVLRLIEARL